MCEASGQRSPYRSSSADKNSFAVFASDSGGARGGGPRGAAPPRAPPPGVRDLAPRFRGARGGLLGGRAPRGGAGGPAPPPPRGEPLPGRGVGRGGLVHKGPKPLHVLRVLPEGDV